MQKRERELELEKGFCDGAPRGVQRYFIALVKGNHAVALILSSSVQSPFSQRGTLTVANAFAGVLRECVHLRNSA